jgi:hypothetical protein
MGGEGEHGQCSHAAVDVVRRRERKDLSGA